MAEETYADSSVRAILEASLHTTDADEILARSILEQAAEAIIVCDRGGKVLIANQVAQQLCGHNPVGQDFDQAFPLRSGRGPRPWHLLERRKQPRLGPLFSAAVLCQGETRRREQFFFDRSDGSEFNLLLSSGPLVAENKVLGCIITLSDITECLRNEDDLQETQARFHRLAESNIAGIVYADAEHVLEANDAFLEMVGYTRADLEAGIVNWREMTPPEFQALTDHKLHELVTTGRSTPYEKEYTRKDGRRVPVLIGSILLDAAPFHCVAFVVDQRPQRSSEEELRLSQENLEQRVQERTGELAEINQALQAEILERRRTENALRQSRAEFQALLESAPDAFISADSAGTITLVNSQTEEMFGYRREELLGQPIEMLLPSRYRALHAYHRAEYNEHPSRRPMGIGLDLSGRRKDGTEFPVEISLSPVQTIDGTHVMSIIRDITDRKQAEEKLSESEARFRRLVQQVRDYAIFGLDAEGRVVSWNVGAERLNGYSADEIIGKDLSIFFPPEDVARGKPQEELRRAAAEGRHEEETEHVRKDGSRYWADVVITAQRDPNGDLRGFSKVIRDVTARKQSEEEIRKLNRELGRRVDELAAVNQELEAFSYSVSHDLRAPLRGIAGFAQALVEDYGDVLDEQAKDYTGRINAATQRMTQLIDDLLMLSRVTRTEMNWDSQVDLSAMARSITAQLQAAQPDRRVEFVVAPDLKTLGDPRLLRVALENLLSNAFKFTSKVPEARIEFGSDGTEDGKTIYFVSDNGAGFDMTFADKLFGPFQRLHATTEFPGTGIGLATVQRIMRRHGGRAWATGELGKGATFYFTL